VVADKKSRLFYLPLITVICY